MFKRTCYHFPFLSQLIAFGIICSIHLAATAQVKEDFSDSDLTSSPPWSGNISNFEVNAYQQLRLKASGAGSSYISTPLVCTDAMEWSIWVRLSFSPSDNNNFRFYLASDNPDPSLANKAFYLQMGEAGSSDAITLCYKNGTSTKEVCRGTSGLLANAFSIRVKVLRSKEGSWKILVDPTGGATYSLEATAIESAPLPIGYLSLLCKYTASNSTGFYFDNISAQPSVIDNTPPLLITATVTENNQIELVYNEPLEKTVSLQINNFRLANGIHPKSVETDTRTASIIWLNFDQPFLPDQPFSLFVQDISDLAGNKTVEKEIQLVYHLLQWNDILINEIMANPIPSNGLPEVEYIELYNRSAFPIRLNNWSLTIGKSQLSLPDSIISAHEYRIIAAESNISKLAKYGKTLAVKSLSLPNEGTLIVLKNTLKQLIHAVNYNPAWHTTPAKKAGGWSLEMGDPLNPCGEGEDFRSSTDPIGGTPGKVNSVNIAHPDNDVPQIANIFPTDSLHVKITFTETVDSTHLLNLSAYLFEPLLGNPQKATSTDPLYQSVTLELGSPLLKKIRYTLTINTQLKDCSGNLLKVPVQSSFALPSTLKTNCIVINEIMYDPGVGKSEFIELYNRSSDFYDLRNIYLSVENTTSGTKKQKTQLSETGILFSPNQYIVLTSDKKQLLTQFPLLSKTCVVELKRFPALSNEGGMLFLTDTLGQNIDKATFNNELHFSLLRSTTGVSLERINPEAPSESKSNWHSASETAGYSTPGKINSQHISQNTSPTLLTLEPEIFSPDNDGKDDNLIIRCNPEKQGCMLTLIIYDSNGRPIRKLLSNVLLSTENSFIWDGLTDERKKASGGIYIVYAEIYSTTGEVQHIKKTTILANRFAR
jgi:hypothetical protein